MPRKFNTNHTNEDEKHELQDGLSVRAKRYKK